MVKKARSGVRKSAMTRASGAAAVVAGPSLSSLESFSALSPEESLRMTRAQIHAALPLIIQAMVEQAKGGSCQHAKFLMEFAAELEEPKKIPAAAVDRDEESLASLLLREIRESSAEREHAG